MIEMTSPKLTHQWATGGVSTYPLTHPIVGQSRFYETFKNFIHLVDQEAEAFAHVFAVVAQWGVGKSRLGYELVSQINDSSRGWYVRDAGGALATANLFHDDADREQYLGLYLRYSQIATEHHNVDNWFAYGLYKALLPLARAKFDTSIQGQIANESYDRLLPLGFDETKLAEALEISANHSDEELYTDPYLVTRLCEQAYAYLRKFGVKYLLIVLDELETVAETTTYGLDPGDIKHLDGRAIKLMGKAIKEEDPRRKLPWLRYVALCSPAIGDELREIKSTARRFEMVELSNNAFADVSDFVRTLVSQGRLGEQYPTGLVEAAYAMSGGNFGWFNVIMANVDGALRERRRHGERGLPTVGGLFAETKEKSSRMRDHVLDYSAIEELKLSNRGYKEAAQELLFGQLPVSFSSLSAETRTALLNARNEYDEPIALLYHRTEVEYQTCSNALREAKFKRDREVWQLNGVDEPLDLRQLLANLSTYAIHEPAPEGKSTLLLPLRAADFVQLVGLLYPHPAAEDAARALWQALTGNRELAAEEATHIGPSIAMLERLNLRYRRQTHNSLIFRDPDESAAFENAFEGRKKKGEDERTRDVLTGAMRLLDRNWRYEPTRPGLRRVPQALVTSPPAGAGQKGGLVTAEALKLHPKGRLLLAWVRNEEELTQLAEDAAAQFSEEGRTPVIAFTASRALVERFNNPSSPVLRDARHFLLLCQLSSGEELLLQQIGLPREVRRGFEFEERRFTSAFNNRLNSLLRQLMEEVQKWRHQLNQAGRIAWPLRPGGTLKDSDRELLYRAWQYLILQQDRSLAQLDEKSGVDPQALLAVLGRLDVTQQARAAGYRDDERAWLFNRLDDVAEAVFSPFLQELISGLLKNPKFNYSQARREWFWGYTWQTAKPQDIFQDWLALCVELGFAEIAPEEAGARTYELLSRSALGGRITEARNWLANEYPVIVKRMESLFGEGKVRDFFSPLGSAPVGTKTAQADALLREAEDELKALITTEEGQFSNLSREQQEQMLIKAARNRLTILANVGQVYLRDDYQRLSESDNIKTLNFEDDAVPLWKRIRLAEKVAKSFQDVEDRMRRRIESLSTELRAEVGNLNGFPINLFTLSLAKIENILQGAFGFTTAEGETQRRQTTDAGTLGQYLKDLKVADAANKLSQLAREVGVSMDGGPELSLESIDGHIVQGLRKLKQAFELAQEMLESLRGRLVRAEVALQNAPDDFSYPASIPPLTNLCQRPDQIEGLLEGLSEEADQMRTQFEAAARLGNFAPLMQEAQNLLVEPRKALNLLSGHVLTLENSITDYHKRLLEMRDVREIETGLNALLRVTNQPERRALTLQELQSTESLCAALALVEERRTAWVNQGNEILDGAGVTFDRWRRIMADLEAGRDPEISNAEADGLVNRGFLHRTYRLGGAR
jgi:hypothetical protein